MVLLSAMVAFIWIFGLDLMMHPMDTATWAVAITAFTVEAGILAYLVRDAWRANRPGSWKEQGQ